ncbi:MAG: hypothetical protein PF488_04785 [Patescibacteria group bacterium]|jgi:hypothetical protein|nr:hypothetical protein [Patescibacteria group bacterium]
MSYKLGTNVNVGNKILLQTGWRKITAIKENGVEVSGNFIEYGWEIYGWKIK